MVIFPFFPELYQKEFLCTLDYLMMNKNDFHFLKKKKKIKQYKQIMY